MEEVDAPLPPQNDAAAAPSLQAVVKVEDNADAVPSTPPQKRKYKAISPEQLALSMISSPPGFNSPKSADDDEHSRSNMLFSSFMEMRNIEKELSDANSKLAAAETEHREAAAKLSEKLQAAEAKALQFGKELQEKRGEHAKALVDLKATTAQLKVLQAAQAQHTAVRHNLEVAKAKHEAKVRQLMDELQAEKAKSKVKAFQLRKELEAERIKRAAEVECIIADSQLKIINAENKSCPAIGEMIGKMLHDRYVTGLRNMRGLVLTMYPGVVDPAKLTPEPLSAGSVLPEFSPYQTLSSNKQWRGRSQE